MVNSVCVLRDNRAFSIFELDFLDAKMTLSIKASRGLVFLLSKDLSIFTEDELLTILKKGKGFVKSVVSNVSYWAVFLNSQSLLDVSRNHSHNACSGSIIIADFIEEQVGSLGFSVWVSTVVWDYFLKSPDKVLGAMEHTYKHMGHILREFCCANINEEVLRCFLKKELDINVKNDYSGTTSFLNICANGSVNEAMIKLLVDAGADLNVQDRNGFTGLMHLVHNKSVTEPMLRFLVNSGVDLNLQDNDKRTALMHLSELYLGVKEPINISILAILVELSDLNIQDCQGVTALMKLCKNESVSREVIELLVNSGASPSIKDYDRHKALYYYKKSSPNRDKIIIKLLSTK